MLVLTAEQARSIDRQAIEDFGMHGLVLMENAGRNAAELIFKLFQNPPGVILCGTGNNGGDGFVIARHLELLTGAAPSVWIVSDVTGPEVEKRMSDDARSNYRILRAAGLAIRSVAEEGVGKLQEELATCRWIIDAIVGTGARGELRAPADRCVALANDSPAARIAIDIPSGLNCDLGTPESTTFRADHTITFVGRKVGFQNPAATGFLGQIHVASIGVPRALLRRVTDEGTTSS